MINSDEHKGFYSSVMGVIKDQPVTTLQVGEAVWIVMYLWTSARTRNARAPSVPSSAVTVGGSISLWRGALFTGPANALVAERTFVCDAIDDS